MPTPRSSSEPVPAPLRAAVLRTHGVDVGALRVHRDEAAERITALHGAQAVTRGGEVFLPDRHGSLEEPAAGGLLAHEVVHVLQQRGLGSAVPAENTAHGRGLERQARAAEEQWRRDASLPRLVPLPAAAATPAPPVDPTPAASALSWERWTPVSPPVVVDVPAAPAATEVVQRAGDEALPSDGDGVLVAAAPPATTNSSDSPWLPTPTPIVTEQTPYPPDVDDLDLDLLAERLYGRLRSRLRTELLVDRERAGMLTDLR